MYHVHLIFCVHYHHDARPRATQGDQGRLKVREKRGEFIKNNDY